MYQSVCACKLHCTDRARWHERRLTFNAILLPFFSLSAYFHAVSAAGVAEAVGAAAAA